MIVKVFVDPATYDVSKLYSPDNDEVLIGVEGGALAAIDYGLALDIALGDFDSVSEKETQKITDHAKRVERFPEAKDETDSALALKEALKHDPDEIVFYGGLGGRLDHTVANLALLKQGPVTFVTESSCAFALAPGTYHLGEGYSVVSFFAMEDVKNLHLKDFRYELEGYDLTVDDPLCVSNAGAGEVRFDEGVLLVILSKT